MSYKDIIALWDKFFFSEGSPLVVAVYRILLGSMICQFLYLLIPDLYVWFGSKGVVSIESVHNWSAVDGFSLLSLAPNNDAFLTGFVVLFCLAAICLTLGFHTRLAAIFCFLSMVTLYHRNPFLFNSGDSYVRVTLFWLIFAASGNALSLDRFKEKPWNAAGNFLDYKPVSMWPQRLLQLQLALVYAHTFVAKVFGEPWIDGTAVYYSSRVEDLQRFPLPYLFEHMWTINLLTWGTLAIELALCTLIWIKETRYWTLLAAIFFHLTIEYHMNIPQFEFLMIYSYILFVEPEHIAKALCLFRDKFCNKFKNTKSPAA